MRSRRSVGITDIASTNITVCRMSFLLLILFTFFNDKGGAGSTHWSCKCVLLKDCWIWWLVLVAEDSVVDHSLGKSPSLGAAGFRRQDTQMDSPLFLYLSKVFYTRLELLLGCRYGSDKLGFPTKDYCFLISAIFGVNGRLLPFASYRSMVTSRSIVAVVLVTRQPRIAEFNFFLSLPV